MCYTLVDDIVAYLSQAVDIGLAGTVVTTLHGVIEQTIDRVAVVLIVLCCVDTALCSDGVSAINAAHIRKRPFERPVVLTFQWNDRLDCSNHAYMAKLIEDGMKGILLHDDSRRWVRGIEHYFHDKPYIRVTVTEVEP